MMSEITKKHHFEEVFDSQRVYRLLLTAISNPTRIVNIKQYADKLYGDYQAMLALAMTVLDNEVSFSACDNSELSNEIVFLTLCKREALENADYIFLTEPSALEAVITAAKCGTLRDPHKSATIIIENSGSAACRLRLYGPGIEGVAEFRASDIVKKALDIRDGQFYEYPQGIDFIFVSENGEVFALPRLTRREVL